jgi:hypothetical protein
VITNRIILPASPKNIDILNPKNMTLAAEWKSGKVL